jgi:hypothetical protein
MHASERYQYYAGEYSAGEVHCTCGKYFASAMLLAKLQRPDDHIGSAMYVHTHMYVHLRYMHRKPERAECGTFSELSLE